MIKTIKDEAGKVRGTITDDEYFQITRERGRHYLRLHQGWGINNFVWLQVRRSCRGIRVVEPDTERVYEIDIATALAVVIGPFSLYGQNAKDEQVAIPSRFFKLVRDPRNQPTLF